MSSTSESAGISPWRAQMHEIIFGAETPAGKAFDVGLLVLILASLVAVSLESVPEISAQYGRELLILEWSLTVLFSIEYVLRLLSVQKPLRYMVSFFGVVDLLAVLPTYLSLFVPGTQSLLVIRSLRLVRVIRIFKLVHFLSEAELLMRAMRQSQRKVILFVGAVLTIVAIMGALLYLIEGAENGFTSIPVGMYWAIVTITTVGYGDVSPATPLGRLVASFLMLLGYGIIAVPTGIFSAELIRASQQKKVVVACPGCGSGLHDDDASFCKLCGNEISSSS